MGIQGRHPLGFSFATVIAVLTSLLVILFASRGGDGTSGGNSRAQLNCDSLQAVKAETNVETSSQTEAANGDDATAQLDVRGIEIDRSALVAFYHATGGEFWRDNTNWLTDKPLGEWEGVKTDSTGRVVELFMFRNGLSGELPAELGSLANLEFLAIWGVLWPLNGVFDRVSLKTSVELGLGGKIPAELGCLNNLRTLDIRDSRLIGEIPPELGNLVNLYGLLLHDNLLTGEIPPELGNLIDLGILDLNRNQLSGEIPPELGRLRGLERLSLAGNQLSGRIPPELSNLVNLEELDLLENQLSGKIPAELGHLDNLEKLSLARNKLSGEIPAELGRLVHLRSLILRESGLSGCVPASLQWQLGTDSQYRELPFCEP